MLLSGCPSECPAWVLNCLVSKCCVKTGGSKEGICRTLRRKLRHVC